MPMPRASHGTNGRYTRHKCRCDACCEAHEAWLDARRESDVARVRAWKQANPERARANNRRYRDKNRAAINAKNLAYYHARMESDPETIRANRRAWSKTPNGVMTNRLARHAQRGAAPDREYAEILYGDPCAYCGTRPVEIDHITPVTGSGDGHWENLTPACRSCNASKSNRTLLAFLTRKAA
jgi:5-methylcytosine-specific restriction endonuclease McrA